MTTITIRDKLYEVPRLDLFQQFDLTSKLSPILGVMSMQKDVQTLERGFPQAFTAMVGQMPREEKDAMISTIMSGVKRQETGGVWASVMVSGRMQYQDVDITVMLKILWAVIVEHKMVDFFSGDPSTSTEAQDVQESSGSLFPTVTPSSSGR